MRSSFLCLRSRFFLWIFTGLCFLFPWSRFSRSYSCLLLRWFLFLRGSFTFRSFTNRWSRCSFPSLTAAIWFLDRFWCLCYLFPSWRRRCSSFFSSSFSCLRWLLCFLYLFFGCRCCCLFRWLCLSHKLDSKNIILNIVQRLILQV